MKPTRRSLEPRGWLAGRLAPAVRSSLAKHPLLSMLSVSLAVFAIVVAASQVQAASVAIKSRANRDRGEYPAPSAAPARSPTQRHLC